MRMMPLESPLQGIHLTGTLENALGSLTSAVAEYGTHLMSHTAVVKNMAGSSEALHAAINQQNEVLADLAAVVKELRVQSRGDNGDLKAGAFGDGYENAPNGTELTLGLSPDGGPERPTRTVNHPSPKGQQERVKGETNVSTDPLRLALEGVLEYAGGRSL